MKKMFNAHAFRVVALVAFSASLVSIRAMAQPTLTGDSGFTHSAALWYLGGIANPGGYNTGFNLTAAAPPGDTNPHPIISWSVNKPSLLSANTGGATGLFIAEGPSYTTLQSGSPVYNITVKVTWDGQVSAPFPVVINMPYSNTVVNEGQYCSAFNACDCNAKGFYPGETGYVTLNNVYVRDLWNNAIAPIDTNETLFNQLHLQTGGWQNLGNPPQSNWPATSWTSQYMFPDYFSVCSTNPGSLSPPPTHSGTGGAAVFTETQDYWIGATANGSGVCTQGAAVTLYTNNGAQSNPHIPSYPWTICTNRATYNSLP